MILKNQYEFTIAFKHKSKIELILFNQKTLMDQ